MIIQQLSLFETKPIKVGSNENYTSLDEINLVHKFYGHPDLDPFSCELANETVKAKTFYSIEDDGFSQDWRGNKTIWLNPPYSQGFLEPVVDKLIDLLGREYPEVLLLTNTDNSTQWYQKALGNCTRFALPTTRLTFHSPERAAKGQKQDRNNRSQTLFYFGQQPQRFEEIFGNWGIVCQTSKW